MQVGSTGIGHAAAGPFRPRSSTWAVPLPPPPVSKLACGGVTDRPPAPSQSSFAQSYDGNIFGGPSALSAAPGEGSVPPWNGSTQEGVPVGIPGAPTTRVLRPGISPPAPLHLAASARKPSSRCRPRSSTDPVTPDLHTHLLEEDPLDTVAKEVAIAVSSPLCKKDGTVPVGGAEGGGAECPYRPCATPDPCKPVSLTPRAPARARASAKARSTGRAISLTWKSSWTGLHRTSIVVQLLALVFFVYVVMLYIPPVVSAAYEIRTTVRRLDVYLNILDKIFGHATVTEPGRLQLLADVASGNVNVTSVLQLAAGRGPAP